MVQQYAAYEDLTEALKLAPTDGAAFGNRGIAKLELQDYQGAVAELTEALKLDPTDVAHFSVIVETRSFS